MKRIVRACAALPLLLLFAATPASRPGLQPVPSQTAQADALRLIQKLFKEDYQRTSQNDQAIFARLLLQESRNTNDNPAARYVLLTEASRLAVLAGEADIVAEAVALLSAQYEVSQTVTLADLLPRVLEKQRTTNQLRSLATQSVAALDLVIAREEFSFIDQLARTAEQSATRVRQVDFATRITTRIVDARELAAEWKNVQIAAEKLKTQPDSAEAHLILGRFYALRLGRFDKGLPELAAGSDEALAKLARQDIASPADPLAQKNLADAWWDYASNTRDSARAVDRARYWYARARDSITGLTLREIDNRLANAPATQTSVAGVPANTDSAIDLVPQTQTAVNAIEGQWTLDHGTLTGTGKIARIQLAAVPPAEYDFEMTFTREGRGGVVLLLANGDKNFNAVLDISGTARIEQINKKTRTDNPTLVNLDLENGKTYTVRAQIRHNAVYVLLDGQSLLNWRTDYQDLSRATQWKLPDPRRLGVGISTGTLHIQRMTLTPISGQPSAATQPR